MRLNREDLGRRVREIWVKWATEQPGAKPSWLVPWNLLPEPEKEVDRRIGEGIAFGVLNCLLGLISDEVIDLHEERLREKGNPHE